MGHHGSATDEAVVEWCTQPQKSPYRDSDNFPTNTATSCLTIISPEGAVEAGATSI